MVGSKWPWRLTLKTRGLKTQRSDSELHCKIIDDGLLQNIPFDESDRILIRLRTGEEGVSFLKNVLPSLGKALDRGLVSGIFRAPTSFARNGELPIFCRSVFLRIFEIDGTLRSTPDLKCIRYLRQLLLLDSKTWEFPTPESCTRAWTAFKQRQRDLEKSLLPNHPVVTLAAEIMQKVLNKLDLDSIIPGHGPGAVAEGLAQDARWNFTYWSKTSEGRYPWRMHGTPYLCPLLSRRPPLKEGLTTRVVLVPKDYRGPRLISVEPQVHQYLQQGQMRAIYKYVARSSFLRRSIRFEDQTLSQMRARTSVDDGTFTLDLSEASDRLSAVVVWKLFSRLPRLRRALFATRTPFATYQGERVRLRCFAPMGSATCFPVETLCFYSLALASAKYAQTCVLGRHAANSWSWRNLANQVTVFGDDIIAPDFCREILLGTLESLGCVPNMDKTCFETSFRESCGAEWFGRDSVTIIRNRRVPFGHLSISDVPDIVALQRKFFLADLHCCASYLLGLARKLFPVPIVGRYDESEPDFLVGDDFNQPYVTRWNSSLFRLEARAVFVTSSDDAWDSSYDVGRLLAHHCFTRIDRVSRRDRKVKTGWRPRVSSLFGKREGS